MSKSEKQDRAGEENLAEQETSAESMDNAGNDEAVDIEVKNIDENVVAEDVQDDDVTDEYETELEKITLMLEDARAKADENWDQVMRLQAEKENLLRRHEREIEKAHKYGIDKFAEELLPALDSLELGLTAAVDHDGGVEKLIEGTELTLKMLKDAMKKFGIKELNPVSEAFNPELHQAMTMQESDKVSPNTVLEVFQKGYKIHDRLIRPARVVVAKATEETEQEDDAGGHENVADSPEIPDSGEVLGTQIDEKA